jgi:hypothetical protein
MKKTKILSVILCLVVIATLFTGCSKKDTFKKDFNNLAKAKSLSTIPDDMTLVSENNVIKVESVEIEPGVTLTTETTKKGFVQKITVQTMADSNNWEEYSKLLIQLYLGKEYDYQDKVDSLFIEKSTDDLYLDLPTTSKISDTVTAHTLFEENDDGTITRTIEVGKTQDKK